MVNILKSTFKLGFRNHRAHETCLSAYPGSGMEWGGHIGVLDPRPLPTSHSLQPVNQTSTAFTHFYFGISCGNFIWQNPTCLNRPCFRCNECKQSFLTKQIEVIGQHAMILVFWMLSFKQTFSLSSFTSIKRLFSSSSLSAVRVVSSAYLRLLIFLPVS